MIGGSVAGGIIAGVACKFLQKVTDSIKDDESTMIIDSNPNAEVEQQLATSIYL